jgi:S1-C subfamily serine protease
MQTSSGKEFKGLFKFPKLTLIIGMLAIDLVIASFVFGGEKNRQENDEQIKDAIVKIYTVYNKSNYLRPWNVFTNRRAGSGCIIKQSRILTNAHIVADQTFVEVQRRGQAKRYRAEVLSVSHQADLAILTVKDGAFFLDVTPLDFSDLPRMQQEVFVYGFPVGGDTLSVTKGVVSRIEHRYYAHSSEYFLAVQIDAAINPGNSGGPVLADGRIVGVVMQMYKSADNIGYMVPMPIIRHFFRDIEDGRYDGFPTIGLVFQKMESPSMKRKYGLSEDQTGVFVRHIFSDSPAEGLIQLEDVILAIDGHPVADNGTVEFRPKERTSFTHYLDLHQVGERIRIDLQRDSEIKTVTFTLNKRRNDFRLVPKEQYDKLPRYFIYGGIVFSPLTKNLIKSWGSNWQMRAPNHLVTKLSEWPTEEKKEVVVALQVLASDVNKGYHDVAREVVEEVNGKHFRDFDEFYGLVMSSREPFLVFRTEDDFLIVIDRKKALESHAGILGTYRIDSDRSDDLKDSKTKK